MQKTRDEALSELISALDNYLTLRKNYVTQPVAKLTEAYATLRLKRAQLRKIDEG